MTITTSPRALLSVRFHFQFFLPMLARRWRPGHRRGTVFSPLRGLLILAGGVLLLVVGLASGAAFKSWLGLGAAAVGAASILALAIAVLYVHWGPELAAALFLIGGILLVALGLPAALAESSPRGWAPVGLGVAAILGVVTWSVRRHRGQAVSYENFLGGFFCCSVMAGLSGGIYLGTPSHSLGLRLASGVAGLFVGYFAGILAGLWGQRLGWVAVLVNVAAGLAAIGLGLLSVVWLLG